MTEKQTIQSDPNVLAIVHRLGTTNRVIVANARNGRPTVIDASEITGDESRLEAHLAKHRVGRVIGVLPASKVICRTCTLPDAEPEQLEQALRLQAEAHTLGTAPEHRTAMAVLPAAPGETSRSGVIVSWPESATFESPTFNRPTTFAPDVTALAALLNGLRPGDPVLWLDRPNSAIALAVTHANGAVFRCTREEAESTDDWTQRVTMVLAETALSGGHTGPFVDSLIAAHRDTIASVGSDQAMLDLPADLIDYAADRIDGVQRKPEWWSRFGIAVGVLLAHANELNPLTALLDEPDVEQPAKLDLILQKLAQPRNAIIATLVSLAIVAVAPVAASGLRLAILNIRYDNIDRTVDLVNDTKRKVAMYEGLEGRAWSMTKLLADIVTNTPEGIQLEVVRLNRADRSFAVSGTALPMDGRSAKDVLALMQERLAESDLFSQIDLNWGDRNAFDQYEFSLSAKIERPHRQQRIEPGSELDWEHWPLALRQAGRGPELPGEEGDAVPAGDVADAGAGPSAQPALPDSADDDAPAPLEPPMLADAGSSSDEVGGSDSSRSAPDRDRIRFPGRPGGSDGPGGSFSDQSERADAGSVDPGRIPEPLTQQQIDNMPLPEVEKSLIEVAKARGRLRGSDDEELRERLKNEFQMLMQRKREAGSDGGSEADNG